MFLKTLFLKLKRKITCKEIPKYVQAQIYFDQICPKISLQTLPDVEIPPLHLIHLLSDLQNCFHDMNLQAVQKAQSIVDKYNSKYDRC
jgi:hypothetical protein